MDPLRPCNSKSRAKNRYTRAELEELAKQKGIKDISKKTIDVLSKEISSAPTKPSTAPAKPVKTLLLDPTRACGTNGPNKYSRSELIDIAKKVGITKTSKMTMKDICYMLRTMQTKPPVPSPEATKCLIDINRPCGKEGANKYTSKEIKELWKSECKDLPEFKKIKPTTLKGYCSMLHKRYDLLMLSAVAKIPETIKKSLKTWLDRVKTKISKTKNNLSIP